MDHEKAIQKIQKLFALAKNGGGATEGEVENALRQAEAMMRKFGIEQSECVESVAKATFDWCEDFAPYGVARQPAKSVPAWYQFIATGVAAFTDTIAKSHFDAVRGYGVGFYGERGDVMFAVWLVTYLRDTVWKVASKQTDLGRGEREDFRKAMGSRLASRMKKLRRERDQAFEEVETSTGTALAIVDAKIAQRNARFGAPSYSMRSVAYRDADVAARGTAAGNNVGFGRPLGNTGNSTQLTHKGA